MSQQNTSELISKINELKKSIKLMEDKSSSLTETWLDNKQACKVLRISLRTLQDYRDGGILPFSQCGKKIYYKAEDIEKHLQKHYKPAFRR